MRAAVVAAVPLFIYDYIYKSSYALAFRERTRFIGKSLEETISSLVNVYTQALGTAFMPFTMR